jgi:hypothetical protein
MIPATKVLNVVMFSIGYGELPHCGLGDALLDKISHFLLAPALFRAVSR